MREMIQSNGPLWMAVGGLVIGFLFGALVYRTNFCTMGSISDILSFGDYRRFRAWMLAGATAIIGTQLITYLGVVPLAKTMYLTPSFNWLGNILGGLMFGFGMVFAGGCASRNLARVGGGDLRALLTLVVLGIFAYMAIGGILGPVRNWLEQATAVNLGTMKYASQGLGDILGGTLKMAPATAGLIIGLVIAGVMVVYAFKDEAFRASPGHVISGIGVGLCVVAGWALTGLAFDELADRPVNPISLTYVRPTGDALEWLQRYTAAPVPGFGVATVFGAIFGAFAAAVAMGRFKVTTFSDKGDTVRNLLGAAMMGVGGVMALGCTVGQGITGISTLAVGSFVTLAAIVAGGVYGMKALERILMAEA